MFNWLWKMLGMAPAAEEAAAPLVLTDPVKVPAPVAKAPAAKKAAPKAKAKTSSNKDATMPKTVKKPAAKPAAKKPDTKKSDGLDEMNKRDLLALSKEKGVKSNASMSKAAVIAAIRKG